MITKTLLLLFLLLTLNVNGQNSTTNDSLQIIGKWGIDATLTLQLEENSTDRLVTSEALCNACPEITFSADQLAVIDFPGGGKEEYSWAMKDNKIRFVLLKGSSKNKYLDDEYYIKIIGKESYLEMELEVSEDESYIYVLRR